MTGSGPTVRGELRDQIPSANVFVLDATGIESRFRVIEENRPIDHQRSDPQAIRDTRPDCSCPERSQSSPDRLS